MTLWTAAHQAPLSMGFSRQEYWSGLPFPPPGDLPHPGIEHTSLMSPALTGRFFTTSSIWEAAKWLSYIQGVGDGQRGLVCCDSWGRKESDTTEQLNWAELIYIYVCMCSVTLVVSDSSWPCGLQPTRLSVHGILQERILMWVAMPSSRGYIYIYKLDICITDSLCCTPGTSTTL